MPGRCRQFYSGQLKSKAMKSKIIVITLALTISFNSFGQVRLNFPEARLPEEVVYAASNDSVINAGLLFHPKKDSTRPIAVIWVHGWGVNFYSPSYISIGRAFAEK